MQVSDLKRHFQNNPFTSTFTDAQWQQVLNSWSEPHRHWHGLNHLTTGLNHLETTALTTTEKQQAKLVWLFHDVVYLPKSTTNEEDSVTYFERLTESTPPNWLNKAILSTKTGYGLTPVEVAVNEVDRKILTSTNFDELIQYETGIFKEFQSYALPDYIHGRTKFLRSQSAQNPMLDRLADYVQYKPYKIGVYAGSFDPFHVGHMDVLQKAEAQFDKVIVALGVNRAKQSAPLETRVAALTHTLPFHEIRSYEGYLFDFIASLNHPATLVRGLRNTEDLAGEFKLAYALEDHSPVTIPICYMYSSRLYPNISSSHIRSLNAQGTPHQLVPTCYNYAHNKFPAREKHSPPSI